VKVTLELNKESGCEGSFWLPSKF